MNANLIGRTAIGLLALSTTFQFAAAEACDNGAPIKPEVINTIDSGERTKAMAVRPYNCAARIKLRGRLEGDKTVADLLVGMAGPGVVRSHLVVNSNLADALASGEDSIAIGGQASATNLQALAIGPSARALERGSIAIGSGTKGGAPEAIVLGIGTHVEPGSHGGIAIGTVAGIAPDAPHALAIGAFSNALVRRSAAIGYEARAEAEDSVALGSFSLADEENTISVGRPDNPITSLDESRLRRITNLGAGTAGTDAVNLDQMQAAIAAAGSGTDYLDINGSGPAAAAPGTNAIALGVNTRAGGSNSAAFGTGAQALFSDSFAFGSGAQTSRDNQFMLGRPTSNYTMPGLVSPQSRDLQNGALELVTVDSAGNLAADGGQTVANLQQEISGNGQRINVLNNQISVNAGNIAQNTSDIATAQSSITQLEQDLAEGLGMVEDNEGRLLDLRADITSNTAAIGKNTSAIQSNRTDIDANRANIQRLEEGAAGNSVRFEEMETQMEGHETRFEAVDKTVIEHEAQIDANTETANTAYAMASENQARIARMTDYGDSIEMLQSDFESLGLSVYGLAQVVADQADKIDSNKNGVAIANALAGSSWLQANETAAFTLNAGYFEGSSALAFSGTKRLHDKWSANIAIGAAPDRGEIGARAGLRLGW